MMMHRIDLRAPEKGYGKTIMSHLGDPIGTSDSPIYSAARWLIGNGHASPDDTVATYRGETLCMSGKAGELAKWTVQEGDRRGLRMVRYVPFACAPVASNSGKSPDPNSPVLSHERRTSLDGGERVVTQFEFLLCAADVEKPSR
jgi:hypothetical protein